MILHLSSRGKRPPLLEVLYYKVSVLFTLAVRATMGRRIGRGVVKKKESEEGGEL